VSLESDIVRRIINKDKQAFEIVFNENYGLLCAYASKFVNEDEQAEEIVQEVFVKFWEKCETIDPDSSIKSYLYRSVHNTCLNYIKHQKVKDAYREYAINFFSSSSESMDLEAEQRELINLIHEEIDNLPPRCSEIFKLSRYEGLKYQEIAEHLEISIKTVEVQMGKALRILRDKFRQDSKVE
jgi:RNA polymerase sigma-70 factor (ECF subfamily)